MDVDTLPQSLMIIEPENVNSLQALTNSEGVANVDTVTSSFTPLQKANYIRDCIRNMLNIQTTVSQAILSLLWRIYANSLWTAPYDIETGNPLYLSFREWVQEELPGYDQERSDLWDCVRVCESVLPFALQNVLQAQVETKVGKTIETKTITITPTYLIEEVGIAKLKGRRGNFEDENLTREQKAEIMVDMTRLSVRDLSKKYSKRRYEKDKFTAYVNINPEGTADVILPALNTVQIEFIRTALGSLLDEQYIHLDTQERTFLSRLQDAGE